MIKFDKTLFDCYEKVLYIDSNVTIHKKLGDFWNKLDNDSDLVLFSHPDRNFVLEEINELKSIKQNHNKWNLHNNKLNELCENYKKYLNNDLFWLNIQLSNTKINIYEEIQEMYKKYQFKRDQVYFSLIEKYYNILKIDIKFNKNKIPIPDPNNKYFRDYTYDILNGWSDNFSRPFGGLHI